MSNSGDAGAIADMIGQCQDGYEVQLRELDRQIEDEKRRIQKIEAQDRACKARIAQKDQLLKSIRLEKEEVFKATCEAQIEIQELSELKEGIQGYLKSQEDAICLVQQSIQGEKDEIAMIEQRMASRRNQFQGELREIQSKKDMVESHITHVVDKGSEDKRHMLSEIDHLEKNIKDAKETNLSFALEIENANARNEQLVAEYNDLEAKTTQAEIEKFRHESNIREKDGAILRNQDIIRAVKLRISQLESETQGRELQNSKLREEYKKAQSKLAEVEKKQFEMKEEITGLESKLEKSIQNCDQYKCEIDGKVSQQIPEKFNELQADCSNEIKAMATLKEQFNQSPTIEACNTDIINLVTQMEQLKMTLKQADDELNSLEKQQVSGESIETLENVTALESKIKQTERENNELANNMTKLQMDNAAAEDAQEKLKQIKNQLAIQVEEAKKKAGLLAERKTVKLALTKAEDELKSLQQKSFDEEQARSLEITKINAENKQEITELEKKNESVARHFAAAKANPTPSQGRTAPQSLKNTVATQETTKLTQEKVRSAPIYTPATAKTYLKVQKPRRQLVTPPPAKSIPTLSSRMSTGRKNFEMESSSDDDELFK